MRIATTSLAGCFGCHTSFLDIDERIFELAKIAEFDRSPFTDIKHCGPCDIALIEGGVCNAENVQVLRELRANAKILVAIGACAITGGLPAMRNRLDIGDILNEVYQRPGRRAAHIPSNPELPLLLDKVRPVREIVPRRLFHSPAARPRATRSGNILNDLILGRMPRLDHDLLHYDSGLRHFQPRDIPSMFLLPHPLYANRAFHVSESRAASAAASSLPLPP